MKKSVRLFVSAIMSIVCYLTIPAHAITTTPQPPASLSTPDIIVTSIVGGAQLENVELFNQSNTPINLTDWRITFTTKGDGHCVTPQTITNQIGSQWLLPKQYFTVTRSQSASTDCTKLTYIQVLHSDNSVQLISVSDATSLTPDKVYQHKQRANSPTSARTASGTFEADYTKVIAASQATLFSDPLYSPPSGNSGLHILEILPHAKDCAPNNSDPTCGDFIKLYNSSNSPINLTAYRLRTGHRGQSESFTNTFTWGRILNPTSDELLLPAHTYLTLTARNDGQPLSLTDTGGYVWLEDAYGVTLYEQIVEYPDVSSTTKIGKSWALDGTTWRWSNAPQPGRPNYFPPEAANASSVTTESTLRPCASNQYRSPETNRCRNTVTAAATLTPCKENQERNPETNRCRSTLSGSTGPKPCDTNEERNPETNRCRKISATASGHIKGASDSPHAANQYTWIIAIAAVAAAGYAGYEWRQDIALGFTRLKGKFTALSGRLKR